MVYYLEDEKSSKLTVPKRVILFRDGNIWGVECFYAAIHVEDIILDNG